LQGGAIMSSPDTIKFNVKAYYQATHICFEAVTKWRNEKSVDAAGELLPNWNRVAPLIGAESAYIGVIVLGLVETVARAVFSVAALPIGLVCIGLRITTAIPYVQDAGELLLGEVSGLISSINTVISAMLALGSNINSPIVERYPCNFSWSRSS
jgi:hypothetical protein